MKFILSAALVLSLFGCGAMKKQSNIVKAMESYTFNFPTKKVYNAAVEKMGSMFVKIKRVKKKKYEGTSAWQVIEADEKVQRRKSRNRFRVKVTRVAKGKSKLQVFREEESYLQSKWSGVVSQGRMGIYEYNVLEKLDPAKAKEIDAAAAK